MRVGRRNGLKEIWAETDPQNGPMRALFRSRKFEEEMSLADNTVFLRKSLSREAAPRRTAKVLA